MSLALKPSVPMAMDGQTSVTGPKSVPAARMVKFTGIRFRWLNNGDIILN
jgi:hypothetical protein